MPPALLLLGVAPSCTGAVAFCCARTLAAVHANVRIFERDGFCALLAFIKWRDSGEGKQIGHKRSLDTLVESRFASKGARQIDFDEPRFELAVDQDVETKQLKTIVTMRHT